MGKRRANKLDDVQDLLSRQVTSTEGIDNAQLVKLIVQYLSSIGGDTFEGLARDIVDKTGVTLYDDGSDELASILTEYDKYNLEQKKTQDKLAKLVDQLSDSTTDLKPQVSLLVQRYLFLEAHYIDQDNQKSLRILRSLGSRSTTPEITQLIRTLSGLLTDSPSDAPAGWPANCDRAQSRKILLTEVLDLLPPSTSPEPGRLEHLIDQALSYQQMVNPYYIPAFKDTPQQQLTLFRDYGRTVTDAARLEGLPRRLKSKLTNHEDEVWYARYSHTGRYLATASVDKSIIIYDADNDYSVYRRFTGHEGSIMYLSWSHDDTHIISSSFDQTIKIWTLDSQSCKTIRNQSFFNSNFRIWSVEFLGDNDNLIISSPDKELAIFDKESFVVHDFSPDYRVDDLTIIGNERLYAITHSGELLIFNIKQDDYKLMNTVKMGRKLTSITSVPGDDRHVLINLKPDELQLWNVFDPERPFLENKYFGIKQSEFIIRGTLTDRNLVMSGSEDGFIYVWNQQFGNLVDCIKGHAGLVNCISWRPNLDGTRDHCEWASCGDDGTVNIWGY